VAALLAGCGQSSDTSDADARREPAITVDELEGTVGGAAIGDSPAEVAKVFGSPRDGTGGDSLPAGTDAEEIGAPPTYAFPQPCDRAHGASDGSPREMGVTELRYGGVGVSYCQNRAFLFIVSSRGARTLAGATVGRPLAQVRRAYPTLKCGQSTGASTPPRPLFEYCAGRLGTRRYLWLGRDPVRSIAIGTVWLNP
jgi:hypothetical protein